MTGRDRFAESFLNARVAAEYLPKIVDGFGLTVVLALCIVATGLLAGLALAVARSLGVQPLNWLIVFVVDLFRALPPTLGEEVALNAGEGVEGRRQRPVRCEGV